VQFIDQHKRIFLYGANSIAAGLSVILMQDGIIITGVIVGDGEKGVNTSIQIQTLNKTRLYPGDGVILCVDEQCAETVGQELEQKIEAADIALNHFMKDDFFVRPECDVNQSREHGFFAQYRILQTLGDETGTDKAENYHNYCNKYEFFLRNFQDRDFTLIELGVFRGGSLLMWRKFFPNARIIGVDKNEKCGELVTVDERTILLIRDASMPDTLAELGTYQPSVIVDDASHIWSDQIRALFGLYESLTDGGIYILEDINTSFLPLNTRLYADQMVSTYQILSAIAEEVSGNGHVRLNQNRAFFPYADEIEHIAHQTEMVCFIRDSCILIKK